GHAKKRSRLGAKETGRENLWLELVGSGLCQRAGIRITREQRRGHHVHALIGGLRGENRRDKQLVRVPVMKLGGRVRMLCLELVEDLPSLYSGFHGKRARVGMGTRQVAAPKA